MVDHIFLKLPVGLMTPNNTSACQILSRFAGVWSCKKRQSPVRVASKDEATSFLLFRPSYVSALTMAESNDCSALAGVRGDFEMLPTSLEATAEGKQFDALSMREQAQYSRIRRRPRVQ